MRHKVWSRWGQRDDRGDSLIEVLLAIVIIALAAGPLIGALLESIAASAEHRGLATTGTLLESFAETAVSEIQTSPLPGTAYQATTDPSYRLLSNPSKGTAPAGTTVTVFVTGFPSASSFTVHVGPTPARVDATKTYGNGDARITFTITPKMTPSTTPYPITVTATTGSVKSIGGTGIKVTVPAGTTPVETSYRAYEVTVESITCWTKATSPNSFAACSAADNSTGLQLLTFSGTGPSGSLGTLGVVVRDPSYT
jgi:type II secretory pathway pseudopilin PulG